MSNSEIVRACLKILQLAVQAVASVEYGHSRWVTTSSLCEIHDRTEDLIKILEEERTEANG